MWNFPEFKKKIYFQKQQDAKVLTNISESD